MAEDVKKDQSAIIALIVIIILAVFFFGVYRQINTLHAKKVQVVAKTNEESALSKNITSLQSLSTQLSTNGSDLANLKTAFPDSAKPEEIIVMLNSMATTSGVNITNIQPDQQQGNIASTLPAANVTVTVSGDYSAQKKFSGALTNNMRPVLVNSVSLVGQPNNGNISGTYDLGFVTAVPVEGGLK